MATENILNPELISPFPAKALVFDCDGVIALTTDQHFAGWSRLFVENLQSDPLTWDEYHEHIDGKRREDGLLAAACARGISMTYEEASVYGKIKQGYYRALLDTTEIVGFDEMLDLMRKMHDEGVNIAVASSSEDTPRILRNIGIAPWVDVVLARDKIYRREHLLKEVFDENDGVVVETQSKPNPQFFLTACEALRQQPEDVIGFEDAESGIKAFKEAGIVCVAIDRKNNVRLRNMGANRVIRSQISRDELAEMYEEAKALRNTGE